MKFSEFERQRRTAARTALYAALGLTLFLVFLVFRWGGPDLDLDLDVDWYYYDWESLPEVQLLQEYLRIDTTTDNGREIDGARFLAEQLDAAGIPYHLQALGERHANLWAILEGESREALVLHSHIDVDPIKHPEDWIHGPFSGTVEPPYIVGRGVFDMKSVAIAQLMAFLDLAKSGETPKRSVIFLATSSEEVGSDFGTRWILREHPELRDRMWGVLTEGGVLEMRDLDDLKYWGVEVGQKTFVDFMVCSPHRERLEALREDLIEMGARSTEMRASREVRTYLEAYAPTRDDPELAERLSDLDALLDDPGAFLALSPYLRALFRDEVVPFPVEQLEDGIYRMLIKLHLLPGSDAEKARQRLMPEEIFAGLTVHPIESALETRSSPVDHPLFQAVTDLMRQSRPDATVGPIVLPWTASDSRFFRAAGIPSYGFSPFLFTSFETYRVGGPNEKVSLLGYAQGVQLYKQLVGKLTGVDLPNPPLEERLRSEAGIASSDNF